MLDRRCALGASFFVLCSWRSGLVLVLVVVVLVDLVVRHANSKQQTANSKQQTANSGERRTANGERNKGTRERNKGTREQGNNLQRVVVAVVVRPRVCELCALCVFFVLCCVSHRVVVCCWRLSVVRCLLVSDLKFLILLKTNNCESICQGCFH